MYCDTESALCSSKEKIAIESILKEYKKRVEETQSSDEENENLNLDFFSNDADEDDFEEVSRPNIQREYNVQYDETNIEASDPPDLHTLQNHEIRLVIFLSDFCRK